MLLLIIFHDLVIVKTSRSVRGTRMVLVNSSMLLQSFPFVLAWQLMAEPNSELADSACIDVIQLADCPIVLRGIYIKQFR
jgi:hypothetical protein